MLFSTISQPMIFICMTLCGAMIALWYALLSGVRRLLEAGFWLSLICDLLLGMGSAAILIAGLILTDYGRLRLYSLLAAFLGAMLTKNGLISPLQTVLHRIAAFLKDILSKIAKYRPIKVIFR